MAEGEAAAFREEKELSRSEERERFGENGGPEEKDSRSSVVGMAGIGLISLFAMLASGRPALFLHGVVWLALGILLIFFPPRFKIPKWWLGAGLVLLGGASMAFLPDQWFGVPGWRGALEGLVQPLGRMVSAQPQVSVELLACLAVSVVAAWYLSGHRIPDRAHLPMALGVALGIAVYAVVSMLAYQAKPAWSWDPVDTFGIYGNRNHTATVLVMGALVSLGVMLEGIRSRRVGPAGVASLCLVISVWGVLGYSISRAGVLLLVLGILLWLMGLGRRYVSRKVLATSLLFVAVVAGIFWFSDSSVKKRLVEQWALVQAKAAASKAETEDGPLVPGDLSDRLREQPLDFRVLIFRDAWGMITHEPLSGVGLGEFPYVFPQYRKESLIRVFCKHPESNWLLLAAEAGWPTAVLTAAAFIGLFFSAFRAARRRRTGWALSLSTLLAALVVPVHGIFDVPAYHVGISWCALLLVALSFRAPAGSSARMGRRSQWVFQLIGAVILLGGVRLLTLYPAGVVPAFYQGAAAVDEAQAHYNRAMAEKRFPDKFPAQTGPDGLPVNHIEIGLELVRNGIRTSPMEPALHFLHGLLAMRKEGGLAEADEAFAAQRVLNPDWVEVPYWQGLAWMDVDSERAFSAWSEALRRCIAADRIKKGVYGQPADLVRRIFLAAKGKPDLQDVARRVADQAAAEGIVVAPVK